MAFNLFAAPVCPVVLFAGTHYIIIQPDGGVKACPYLVESSSLKVFNSDMLLTSVFLGDEYQALRQIMLDGGPYPAPCLNCPDCRLLNTKKRI